MSSFGIRGDSEGQELEPIIIGDWGRIPHIHMEKDSGGPPGGPSLHDRNHVDEEALEHLEHQNEDRIGVPSIIKTRVVSASRVFDFRRDQWTTRWGDLGGKALGLEGGMVLKGKQHKGMHLPSCHGHKGYENIDGMQGTEDGGVVGLLLCMWRSVVGRSISAFHFSSLLAIQFWRRRTPVPCRITLVWNILISPSRGGMCRRQSPRASSLAFEVIPKVGNLNPQP